MRSIIFAALAIVALCAQADVTTQTTAYRLDIGNANKVSLVTIGTVPLGTACTDTQIKASNKVANIIADRTKAKLSGGMPLQVWAICGAEVIPPTPEPPSHVTLSWIPPTENTDGTPYTNPAGSRIYYGKSQSAMTYVIEIKNPTVSTYVVDGLQSGTWYFKVRAFTTAGNESAYSNIASKTL